MSDYRPPASSYQEPEFHNSLPVQNYEQVHIPEVNYGSFKPISSYEPVSSYKPVVSSYEPVSTYNPIQPFSEPEIDSYGPPAAPPIYETVKPIYEQPAVVSYGPPISTYDPIGPTVSTYEPSQPLYEPEQESYGTPIANPINTFVPTSNPGSENNNNFTCVQNKGSSIKYVTNFLTIFDLPFIVTLFILFIKPPLKTIMSLMVDFRYKSYNRVTIFLFF